MWSPWIPFPPLAFHTAFLPIHRPSKGGYMIYCSVRPAILSLATHKIFPYRNNNQLTKEKLFGILATLWLVYAVRRGGGGKRK